MGVYLVHHPLHNFSPEVGGGRLHGNGRLQGTLQYFVFIWTKTSLWSYVIILSLY